MLLSAHRSGLLVAVQWGLVSVSPENEAWGKLASGWDECQAYRIPGELPLLPTALSWTLNARACCGAWQDVSWNRKLVSKPEGCKKKNALPGPLPWED